MLGADHPHTQAALEWHTTAQRQLQQQQQSALYLNRATRDDPGRSHTSLQIRQVNAEEDVAAVTT